MAGEKATMKTERQTINQAIKPFYSSQNVMLETETFDTTEEKEKVLCK